MCYFLVNFSVVPNYDYIMICYIGHIGLLKTLKKYRMFLYDYFWVYSLKKMTPLPLYSREFWTYSLAPVRYNNFIGTTISHQHAPLGNMQSRRNRRQHSKDLCVFYTTCRRDRENCQCEQDNVCCG